MTGDGSIASNDNGRRVLEAEDFLRGPKIARRPPAGRGCSRPPYGSGNGTHSTSAVLSRYAVRKGLCAAP